VLTQGPAAYLTPARCQRWACNTCGPRKARRLRHRLAQTRPDRLITLTLRTNPDRTATEMLATANQAWSILWRRLRRLHPSKTLGYAKIVELTRAGTPHLHILVSAPYIAQAWLASTWEELTGSYIVHIRRVISTKPIAGYLTAYLTKALQVPPGMRKWSASRGYVPKEQPCLLEDGELPPETSYRPADIENIRAALVASGWTTYQGWLINPHIRTAPNAPISRPMRREPEAT
jgi:hypothetical protein